MEGFNRTSKAEGKAVAQAHLDPLQAIKGVVSDIGMHEFLQADLSTVHVATVRHRPGPKAHHVIDIVDPDRGMSAALVGHG